MTPLPIDGFVPEVLEALRGHRSLVLVAEPGAGKTTRVPPAVALGGVLSAEHPAVVMLQPRRVAARAAAERIADERGWEVGEQVGYQVRFERRITARTQIRVLTEAILSRQLLSDPELVGVGCVILDEFHERSVHSDLALALLREVQESIRPDLKIIVMSATLDAEPVARFLGDCPVVRVPGRVFPVEVEYRPGRLGGGGGGGAGGGIGEAMAAAVELVMGEEGHVLCFLPGAEEIRWAERLIRPIAGGSDVLPLHGTLPFEEQRRAVAPSARRKIILATNIAETSLTIDGVRVVVDSGLSRQTSFDVGRGIGGVEALRLGWISQASAAQRAGRAGRTSAGRCVRLWSSRQQLELLPFDLPEIRRIDLTGTLLTLLSWGVGDVEKFGWFEPPAAEALRSGMALLRMLGAVEGSRVTSMGKRMAEVPLHPRLARLLVDAADAGMVREGATWASLLSERDIRLRDRSVPHRMRGPRELADSDLTTRVELLENAEKRGFHPSLADEGVDGASARQVARTRDELLRRAPRAPSASHESSRPPAAARGSNPPNESDLILRAFGDRVCLRRAADPAAGLMVGNVGVTLAPESAVRRGECFLALTIRDDERTSARQASVELAQAVDLEDVRRVFPGAFARRASCVYDAGKDKVVGRVQTVFHDLVIEETDDARVEDEAAAEALAAAALPRLQELIARDEHAAALLGRVKLAEKHVPAADGTAWPSGNWERFSEQLKTFLLGKRRLGDAHLAGFLESLLVYPLDRVLEQQVPTHWTVPTGNRIRIDYGGAAPTLSVRLQEMFGQTVTPRICGGRVALVIHLLSPGYKPVQVTQDLESFWKNTYAQVKKDLKARYPKHAWPENPLEATPVAKGRATQG